jgi:hypothetical protein
MSIIGLPKFLAIFYVCLVLYFYKIRYICSLPSAFINTVIRKINTDNYYVYKICSVLRKYMLWHTVLAQ